MTRLIVSFFEMFSLAIFGKSLVMTMPIIITAKGWTLCEAKETKATEVIVPARVEKTPPKELKSSFKRFRQMMTGPLVFIILLKDLRKDLKKI